MINHNISRHTINILWRCSDCGHFPPTTHTIDGRPLTWQITQKEIKMFVLLSSSAAFSNTLSRQTEWHCDWCGMGFFPGYISDCLWSQYNSSLEMLCHQGISHKHYKHDRCEKYIFAYNEDFDVYVRANSSFDWDFQLFIINFLPRIKAQDICFLS
jgi:hypothetical protein